MTVYMPDTDYKAICDATREKCGTTALLKSGEIKPLLEALETGGAKFYLTVAVASGSTVVANKGDLAVSGTSVDGVCALTLPEAGEWTIVAALEGGSATASVNIVGDYAVNIAFYDPVFANNSWAEIIEACQIGNIPATWAVGDQKTMSINGVDYAIDIVGKAHDDYADGSGKAPLTLQLHDCYGTTYKMHSSGTNSVGWSNSAMRKTYMPAILALMPSEVQTAVREVNKLTSAGAQSATIGSTADKLFLLSEVEFYGSNNYSMAGEGEQYEYYKAGNSPVKMSKGSVAAHYARSPYKGNSTGFCRVYTDGALSSTASTARSVAPAFCF